MKLFQKDAYPKVLLGIFVLFWLALAIAPKYRQAWVAENILTVLFILLLVFTYKHFRFSNFSYTLLFGFMILHSVGAYYSYTENPLFDLLKEQFSWERNHYDRVVHFLFGFVFFFPVQEFYARYLKVKGWWSYFMSFVTIISFKALYEIIEYVYLLVTRSDVIGDYFLGMQGDQWDAQKDMILGILGACLAWLFSLVKK